MPRIAAVTLDQVNKQIDVIDSLQKQVGTLQIKLDNVGQSISIADPIHAPQTTNNITFTWTGSTRTLSWNAGYLKTKNWDAQTLARPAFKSTAPGQQHVYAIPVGSLVLVASTYYWLGWDPFHQAMQATQDASVLHSDYNVHIISQVYTGTAGQTGSAGGGGSTGGIDLSGGRYKNF